MLKIQFVYSSQRICPSLYFMLFFQLVGFDLQEDWLDVNKKQLLDKFPSSVKGEGHVVYDMALYYAASENEYEECVCKIDAATKFGHILVHPQDIRINEDEFLSVVYEPDDEYKALNSILNRMLYIGAISKDEHISLCKCLDLYEEHKIWELYLEGRFFYAPEAQDKEYTKMRGHFIKASKACFNMAMDNGGWGEMNTLPLQFMFLNLAYEGDFYCVRARRLVIYTENSLVQACQRLLESVADCKWKASLCFLLAQIYDNLLYDYNMALHYYGECEHYFQAQVHYHKGFIFQDWVRDYERALEHYLISVQIFPVYYRSWYQIGRCLQFQDRYKDSLTAFHNITDILQPRMNTQVLQPMEFEYLIKAQNQRAYMYNKILNWLSESVLENQTAIKVWQAMDTSCFYQQMGYVKRPNRLWDKTKEKLPVRIFFNQILKLANKLKDEQLTQDTQKWKAEVLKEERR